MNPEHEPYIQILIANMIKAKLGALERKAVMLKFLREVAEKSPAQALVKACEGWDDGQAALGSLIENALKKANESTIETNSLVRLKEKIQRHNATMEKASQFGIEGGSPLNPEQLKMKMPSFINSEHEAKANYKSLERLEYEIR
jgi:hypothetical protein